MGKNFAMPKMEQPKPLTVTSLTDGGLNLSDRARHIGDNESPDMENFWRHEDQLRLRPGLRKAIEHSYGSVIDVYPRDGRRFLLRNVTMDGETVEEKYGIYIVTQKAVLCYDGETYERVANSLSYNDGWVGSYTDYDFEKCVFLSSGSASSSTFSEESLTWTASGEEMCLVGSNYFLVISPQVVIYEKPTGVPHITATCLVKNVEPHVPVLYVDCAADGKGTKSEEHNMIGSKCIQKFSTDTVSNVYNLCDDNLDNTLVTAVYKTAIGSTYTFSFDPSCTLSTQSGIVASLDRLAGTILFTYKLIDATALGIKSNLVVTYNKTVYTNVPVCGCKVGTWFDGGTQSGTGYSRIFLSGFESAPNRIYYSAASDPTYFAENAYIDVGAPDDPITAFGIQYDILAVFKKNSIYSLTYSGTTDSETFTIKEVNDSVGCDMPATLRLASNILIWGSSIGGVYALRSTTIKDERAVQLVSQNVNAKLLALSSTDLQAASAICDGTSYFLLVGSSVFILNYEEMHFISGKSPEGIAWFVWNLPQKLSGVFWYDSHFAASSAVDGTVYLFDDDVSSDYGNFFDAHWYSKSFDFGVPEKLKRLYRFMLTFGCDHAVRLEICFCDNASERRQTVTVDGSNSWEKTLAFSPAATWSGSAQIGIRRVDESLAPFSIIEYTAVAVSGAQIS